MRLKTPSELFLYGIGLFCAISSVYVFLFFLYLIPYLFLNLQYVMPEFISYFREWFIHHQSLSGYSLAMAILFPILLVCILLGFIARLINQHLDSSPAGEVNPELAQPRIIELRKSLSFPVTLLLIIVLVILGLYFAHYLIST